MSRRAVAHFCAIPTALFLLAIGLLHGFVNVSGMQRAIARGDVPQRLPVLWCAAGGSTLDLAEAVREHMSRCGP
jgi:hypothetical protein